MPREVAVLDANDQQIGAGTATRVPGQGLDFDVTLNDGSTLTLQIAPRGRAAGRPPPGIPGLAHALRPRLDGGDRRRSSWRSASIRSCAGSPSGWRSCSAAWSAGARATCRCACRKTGRTKSPTWRNGFNAAADRIEQLVRSHKSLLANASHELRSPLTRIRMGLELMGERPSPAAREEISRNIAELDQLIDEILLASRLDAKESRHGHRRDAST